MTEELASPAPVDVTGYRLILPRGWVQHPVRPGVAERLLEHVRAVFEQAPRAAPLYTSLRSAVLSAVRELKANGGLDIYLPERTRSGGALPVSVIASMVTIGDRGIEAALPHLSRGAETEPVTTDAGPAWFWNSATAGREDWEGIDSIDRFCIFPVPGEGSTRALLFTFGVIVTPDLDEDYRDLLFALFDSLMFSLAWETDERD